MQLPLYVSFIQSFISILLSLTRDGEVLERERTQEEKKNSRDSDAMDIDIDGQLHVWTLPVGQGDCRIIQCPDGELNLFDCGRGLGTPSTYTLRFMLLFMQFIIATYVYNSRAFK